MKAQRIFLGFRIYQSGGKEKDFHPALVTYLRVSHDSRSETVEKALSHSHQPCPLSVRIMTLRSLSGYLFA